MKAYLQKNLSEGLRKLKMNRAEKKLEKSISEFVGENLYLNRD